ncbi:hypothetical protein [Nonomuraea jiangxiensis]|uniref:Anti-sigma regulatory factor (Ser/Thr protein kinase) n=1 Tax=Nonomuraea jiangxiensis TaxID=633440 RepID=A0A1G8JKH4_9ACTN|nr:hypothetical protein [Nonomuraea jiangxiensis]SDI31715.1 hypothetical protein SAMN05421869_105114 [Nonomuraea jiangxiensis]
MCHSGAARGDAPRRPVMLGLRPWNTLLVIADTLAVRTRRAANDHDVSWTLAARPSAVPTALRLTALRLAAWDLCDHVETTQRLVGALVADALDYAIDGVRVGFHLEDGLLRCEVEDTGSDSVPARHNPIATRLACCSGVADNLAWFELVTDERNHHHPPR